MNDGRGVWVWVLVVLGGIATLSVIHFLIASLAPALFCGAAEPAPWSLSGRGGLSAQACSEIARNYSWAAAGSFAGLVALVALYFNAQRTGTDRQRLTNDTYVKAIEQLASDSVEVRIGAMYALEQIARENQRYHWPIMETLAAYVRERAPWPPKDKQAKGLDAVARSIERVGEAVAGGFPPPAAPAGEGPEAEGGTEPAEGGSAEERKQPPTDIQTALTIIATRPAYRRERHPGWLRRQAPKVAARLKRWKEAQFTRSEPVYRAVDRAIAWLGAVGQSPRRLEPRRIDLHGTDLRGAALLRAALSHADLRGANLMHANLFGANLEGADLQDADLQDAD
ncbi:MAG TPA: pentapeptide repeat-containing protein, partial [Alphaproteobacteria bacterium]|nr:pentapeptide repeat-containing protein [Alphaproteobacteria bacterium]